MKSLYEVFDKFLNVDTWHTRHPYDEERFFVALAKVIRDPEFSPETLGDYIREKKNIRHDDDANLFNPAVNAYVAAAWAVKDYLKANRL